MYFENSDKVLTYFTVLVLRLLSPNKLRWMRGITLLPVARKVLSNLIYNRLREAVDSNMREEQAGFRQGRGCSDQIFVLRTIIEECEEWKTPLLLNFIDLKKAFDSIHRPSMWKILEFYGIPSKIIRILASLYEGSESCVRVGAEHTEWFNVDTGVVQGDSLSPVLFNIVLDFVMAKLRTIDGGIEWVDGKLLKDLDYADDICLLARDMDAMKQMTELVVGEADKVGLKINTRKTEIMKIRSSDNQRVIIDNTELKEVEKFTYLGCEIRQDGNIRNEVGIRVGKAGSAFRTLNKVWNAQNISLSTKLKLFSSIVISILIYGCESWKGLKEIENRVRRFESGCLRKILNIRWFDRVSEVELRRRTGQRSVVELVKSRRWRWYGHVLRMPQCRLPKQAIGWTPSGRRSVGRPKDTWRRTMTREMREENLDHDDVVALAEDRHAWRNFVADLWTT